MSAPEITSIPEPLAAGATRDIDDRRTTEAKAPDACCTTSTCPATAGSTTSALGPEASAIVDAIVDVLLVEDSAADAQPTSDALVFARAPRCRVTCAEQLAGALALLSHQTFDVILLDLDLPDGGLDGVRALRAAAPETALVVLVGLGCEAVAVSALGVGAQDHLVKGRADGDAVQRSIRFAIARREADVAQRRFAAVVESSDDAIITRGLDATIASWNLGAERLYGYTCQEAVGQPFAMLVPEDCRAEEHEMFARVLAGERVDHRRTSRLCKDGTTKVVALTASAVSDAHGGIIAISSIARDITDSTLAEESLRAAEERFRCAFDEARIGMMILDLGSRYERVNDAFCAIVGHSQEQLIGLAREHVTHPDDVAADVAAVEMLLAGQATSHMCEKRYIHANGHPVWAALNLMLIRDPHGRPRHFIAQVQDITQRRSHERQLQHMADHDPLTGLLNRRSFERELTSHVTRVARYGPTGAVLLIDLDNFKYLNDTQGHNAGDELIVRMAQALRTRLRESDVLARLGGDEFAILLAHEDEPESKAVAEALLQVVGDQTTPALLGEHRRITASVGIARFDDGERLTSEEIMVNADLAMYDAKEAGGARFARYRTDQHERPKIESRMKWARQINEAIANDGFELLAQPIVPLRTSGPTQYELLLRMRDEHGSLIPPGSFLYVAERLGLIREIDRWVTERAIGMLAEQRAAGRDLRFEVNLSGYTIGDDQLLELIERRLAETGVPADRLIFEITETAAIENITRAARFADRLSELGCRFALDDFGAGFGSFYYLKHLPFDYLKIDGEFVRHCAANETDRILIAAVVQIARGMGKWTIAEFVTDQETLDVLTQLGVDYGQGYRLGRPAPLERHLAAPPQHVMTIH
jgi:diguanylate cyclase (GGDEF)-like protein/PAS domain S-box-containing protein